MSFERWHKIGRVGHCLELFAIPALTLIILSCTRTRAEYVELAYPGDFPTSYGAVRTTPGGVRYSAEQSIPEDKLDFIVQTVFECAQKLGNQVPPEDLASRGCRSGKVFEYPDLRRMVVVIGPWEMSCDGKQQLLKVDAPVAGCRNKGIDRDFEKCPCRWRSGVREGASEWSQFWRAESEPLMITTPSLYMLSDPLARYVSACLNPWVTQEIIKCARPRVPILPED